MARIEIDLNVRVRGHLTYSGFEDVVGPATEGDLPVAVGETVEVFESESGLAGTATVTEVDATARLIYLEVAWADLIAPTLTVTDVQGLNATLARHLWTDEQATGEAGLGLYGVLMTTASPSMGLTWSINSRPLSDAFDPAVA